jgi:hypothetical protein
MPMDNRQFGESYRPLTEKIPPSNPERREILEAPRMWMRFFNETMQNYLAGNEPPRMDVFIQQIGDYHDWSHLYLEALIQKARKIDNPLEQNDIANEFFFHQINSPLAFLWSSLLYSEKNFFSSDQIADMQAELAVSMALSSRRLKLIDEKPSPQTRKEYAMLKGALSEADTTITLMELMKKDDRLIVLPAPEQFENNKRTRNRNVDLLLIDTLNKQVRGIQVKTNTVDGAGAGAGRIYDKKFVTVVDGAHELGNSAYTTNKWDRRQSLPGQIAMGLLSERPINKPPVAVRRPDYFKSRQIAVELSRGRKSFLGQATQNLKERVMPELEVKQNETQQTA